MVNAQQCGMACGRLMAAILVLAASAMEAGEALPGVHFKPADHALGDVHPFFHGGTCYLYYLKPGKYESALVCSRDLLHWTPANLEHSPVGQGDRMSPYFVLGVFRDESAAVYRSFYGHAAGRIASSVSSDLLRWSCAPEFELPPAGYYARRRDPFVYWVPEQGRFGCVMTTKLKERPDHRAGAISLATSVDLKGWQDLGPVFDPGNIGEPECPQVFRLGTSWYLLASIYDRAVGRPVYWISDAPFGGWENRAPRPLDGKDLCAAQAAFDEGVPVLFGWIPLTPSKPGSQTWGGHLALPREIVRLPDGSLGVRLARKLAERFALLSWQSHPGGEIGGAARYLPGERRAAALECSLNLPEEGGKFEIGFPPLGAVSIQPSRLRIRDGTGECWSELEVDLPSDRSIAIQLFVEEDIAELFVGDRYALAARLPSGGKPFRLTLGAAAAGVRISSLRTCDWMLPQ